MIYIYVALYQEAKPVIRAMQLKKRPGKAGFDIYENDTGDVRLILTGVGALSAATAVGSSLGSVQVEKGDALINWGSCAAEMRDGQCENGRKIDERAGRKKKVPEIYRCHTLIDRVWGRTYFPDMIFGNSLPEACVVTEPKAWNKCSIYVDKKMDKAVEKAVVKAVDEGWIPSDKLLLHDMEAAAIYFAGAHFFSPNQMHFLKVVTDRGAEDFSRERFDDRMERALPTLLDYIECVKEAGERYFGRAGKDGLEPAKKQIESEKIFRDFCCSETMRASLQQCIRYWSLAGIDYQAEWEKMRAADELPCKDRREGKRKIEEFKSRLL